MAIEKELERFDRDRAQSDADLLCAMWDIGSKRAEQLGPLVDVLRAYTHGAVTDDMLAGFACGIDAVCGMVSRREERRG